MLPWRSARTILSWIKYGVYAIYYFLFFLSNLWAILSFGNFASHQVWQTFLLCGRWIKLGVLCSFQGERLPYNLWMSGSLCQGLVFPCCALVSEFLWKTSCSFTSVRYPSVSQLEALCVCSHLKYKIAPPHCTLLSLAAVLLSLPNV